MYVGRNHILAETSIGEFKPDPYQKRTIWDGAMMPFFFLCVLNRRKGGKSGEVFLFFF